MIDLELKDETHEKKTFSKEEKHLIKKLGEKKILKLGKKLKQHTKRNSNTNHINYKIFHLLYDPFTFVNAYTKISKNKGIKPLFLWCTYVYIKC